MENNWTDSSGKLGFARNIVGMRTGVTKASRLPIIDNSTLPDVLIGYDPNAIEPERPDDMFGDPRY